MEEENNIQNAKFRAREDQILSIPAQQIWEKIKDIPSAVNKLKRRWFWELLQNASDYNDEVKIILELYPDKIIFKHNGKPFSASNARNLIAPNSDKTDPDLNIDDMIGQFGTGFISTHVLSSVIKVTGILEEEGSCERFSFDLDRTGYNDKEQLKQSISSSSQQFEKIGTSVRCQTGSFDSSFEYNLSKPLPGIDVSDVVKSGLDCVYEVLPFTLAFLTNVQSVRIENNGTSFIDSKVIEFIPQTEENGLFKIKIQETNENEIVHQDLKSFMYSDSSEVKAIVTINNLKILEYPEQLPKLFCALPLIGTEKFSFPVAINSAEFVTQTERDAIRLSKANDPDNRKLMLDGVKAYKTLLSKLINLNYLEGFFNIIFWDNCLIEDYDEKEWYTDNVISDLKQFIIDQPVVYNSQLTMIVFNNMKLPYLPKEDLDKQLLTSFYDLTADFYPQFTPRKEDFYKWYDNIDFVVFNSVKYKLEHLLEDVQGHVNIECLGKTIDNVIDWLNNLINLVIEVNEKLLDEYRIIPNQLGEFVLKSDKINWDNQVDEELIEIYNTLAPDDYRSFLLHKEFEKNELLFSKERFLDTSKIAKDIDDLLSNVDSEDRSSDNFQKALRSIFSWFAQSKMSKKELKELFKWFSGRKPQLFLDIIDDLNRDKVFAIAQSEKLDSLSKLAESNISTEDLNTITSNAEDLVQLAKVLENVDGGMSDLLRYAELIKQDDEDFKYKQEIGEKVERIFNEALMNSDIDLHCNKIEHDGIGSHDFEITNNTNKKKFYIELKSYKHLDSGNLQLATSQARFGSENPENYCLAIVQRTSLDQITEQFIKNNLSAVTCIGSYVEEGLSDYHKFNQIRSNKNLHLTLRDAIRINVSKLQINTHGKTFDQLIETIKIQLA
jgi:hypothetical protein